MLASIKVVITPPIVSIPKDKGVTSSNNTSFTSPDNTPPWIAAPIATTSSGLTPLDAFLPKNFSTSSTILGIRVEPPTKITSSMSEVDKPASFNACATGAIERFTKLSANCSNLERDNFLTKCFGPEAVAVTYGKLISVSAEEDNSIFAFSAASLIRCNDIGSKRKSIPSSALNSSANQSMITWSKSSPPK